MKNVNAFIILMVFFSCIIGERDVSANNVFRSMSGEEKTVYLTFDDGPDKENTLKVMNELLKYEADATFFFTGINMKRYPDVVKQVYDNGFAIGLHGYDHSSLAKAGAEGTKKQLNDTNDILEGITGERSYSMRPPYGDLNKTAIDTMDSMGFSIYMWNIDPKDWSSSMNNAAIMADIKKNLKPGSIILLHSSAGQVKAIQILPELIGYLRSQGYQIKALPDSGYKTIVAKVSTAELKVNNKPVNAGLYTINGSNYIKIRELAALTRNSQKPFDLTWNEESRAIEIITGKPYAIENEEQSDMASSRAIVSSANVTVNGEPVQISSYLINGSNYFNLRELAEIVGIEVSYDKEQSAILLRTCLMDINNTPGFGYARVALSFNVWRQVFWQSSFDSMEVS